MRLDIKLEFLGVCAERAAKYKGLSLIQAYKIASGYDLKFIARKLMSRKCLTRRNFDLLRCAWMYGSRQAKQYGHMSKVPIGFSAISTVAEGSAIRRTISFNVFAKAFTKLTHYIEENS